MTQSVDILCLPGQYQQEEERLFQTHGPFRINQQGGVSESTSITRTTLCGAISGINRWPEYRLQQADRLIFHEIIFKICTLINIQKFRNIQP